MRGRRSFLLQAGERREPRRVYTRHLAVMTSSLDYSAWRTTRVGVTTERLERAAVLDLAGPIGGLDVLDVGCGDGQYALAAAGAGARVTGVDASPKAVEAGRRRAAGAGLGTAFLVGAANELPFAAEQFDVVLAVTVVCFVSDPEEAVAEMARVLRPGGLLVLADLGRCSLWAAWRRMRGWAGNVTWRRARFWTLSNLRALVHGAGLEPARWRAAAFYPPVAVAARLLAPLDATLGAWTSCGAAFLAIQGRKRASGMQRG